jgi:hypothetical protein
MDMFTTVGNLEQELMFEVRGLDGTLELAP